MRYPLLPETNKTRFGFDGRLMWYLNTAAGRILLALKAKQNHPIK